MSEEAISTVQEDIAKDLYEMAACYREEVNRIMREFDKHDVNRAVQLDNIEAERVSKTLGLRAPESAVPRPSPEETTKFKNEENEDIEDEDEDADNEARQEEESSLFDILQDNTEDDLDENHPLDKQE